MLSHHRCRSARGKSDFFCCGPQGFFTEHNCSLLEVKDIYGILVIYTGGLV